LIRRARDAAAQRHAVAAAELSYSGAVPDWRALPEHAAAGRFEHALQRGHAAVGIGATSHGARVAGRTFAQRDEGRVGPDAQPDMRLEVAAAVVHAVQAAVLARHAAADGSAARRFEQTGLVAATGARRLARPRDRPRVAAASRTLAHEQAVWR